ncbi:rCG44813 [Rattus norvegicus]|uniref:RCG44813 n=1 Tax=Rattus norvegicus TaxID=10116 RepID=A6I5T6_RAT|nr:rCG44813 [Rattus norvegicus]
MMRQQAQERKNEEMEVMEAEDEGCAGEESESESESEKYTDSEDEMVPRLKPVFIRKEIRVTVQEREAEPLKQRTRTGSKTHG